MGARLCKLYWQHLPFQRPLLYHVPWCFNNGCSNSDTPIEPSPTSSLLQGSKVQLHPLAHAQFASLNSAQSKKKGVSDKNLHPADCAWSRCTKPSSAFISDQDWVAGRPRQRYNVETGDVQPTTIQVCELKLCMLVDTYHGSVFTPRAFKVGQPWIANLRVMWTDGWVMSNCSQDSQKVLTPLECGWNAFIYGRHSTCSGYIQDGHAAVTVFEKFRS